MGRRDLTVRELFRTAAFMANEDFVVRHGVLPGQPSTSAAGPTATVELHDQSSVTHRSDVSSGDK